MCQEICEYDTIYESRLEISKYRTTAMSFKYLLPFVPGKVMAKKRCSIGQYTPLPMGRQWPEIL